MIGRVLARWLAGLLATLGLHGHAAHHHARLRLPADYAAWTRVADCESGGWRVLGTATGNYPDAVGVDRANYLRFGGVPQPHGPVPLAGRVASIRVADRLIRAYRIPIPDQGAAGCQAW